MKPPLDRAGRSPGPSVSLGSLDYQEYSITGLHLLSLHSLTCSSFTPHLLLTYSSLAPHLLLTYSFTGDVSKPGRIISLGRRGSARLYVHYVQARPGGRPGGRHGLFPGSPPSPPPS